MKLNKLTHLITLILVFFAALAIVFVVWGKIKAARPICDKCNVVLISIDTLSALHLPCYGYERNTAPNLCSFADKNINFLNSYSHSPTTLNSHFSIFTSLYPHTSKMTDVFEGSLNEKHLTLPQLYKMNGYKTFYYGPPTDIHLPLNRGIERGFDFFQPDYSKDNENNWDNVYQTLIENTHQKLPSFFFLHTYAVHDPYLTGHQSRHPFTNLPEYPNIALTQKEYYAFSMQFFLYCASLNVDNDKSYINKIVSTNNYSDKQNLAKLKQAKNLQEGASIFNTLDYRVRSYCFNSWNQSKVKKDDSNQIEYLKALYDEQIYKMDQGLGKFLELMTDPILAKNTIIIITADHGEEFMEHGKLYHGNNIYRTSTQVPLIMHIPGIKSKKITELVQGIDIYPTVLSLTNLAPKSPIEGISLSGLIKGENNAKINTYIRSEWRDTVAVQNNNLRYYYNNINNNPLGLYDITSNPNEQDNLMESNPEIIVQFKKMLKNKTQSLTI